MRITLKLFFVFVFTFFSCGGVDNVQQNKQSNISSENKPRDNLVPFCTLINNPDNFDGKEVHTKAILLVGSEFAFLYDTDCIDTNKLVWFESVSESNHEKLYPFLSKFSKGVARAKAEIIGKFETKKDKGFGHQNSSDYRFSITEVLNVISVPDNTPLPFERYKN